MAGSRWIVQLISALYAVVVGGAAPVTVAGTAGVAAPNAAPVVVVQVPTSWSAVISWAGTQGAARYQVWRDGRLIDDFPEDGNETYTDYLLWPSSTYTYQVKALDAKGSVISDSSATARTPSQIGTFPRFYSDASLWNSKIASSPSIDPNSQAMVAASLTTYKSLGVVNNDDQWGIPLAYADSHSTSYTVQCLLYGCDKTVQFRIPRYARANTGSDGHLAVYDPASGQELDLWQGVYDGSADAWKAGARTATAADWGAACSSGLRCGGGGTGAGFLEFGGVIRPEEIAQGHIDHALVLSTPYVRANFIACPGTNYWASQSPMYHDDPNAIPLGARVQLDPSIDVDRKPWPAWQKVVAKALQTYGAYVADVSGTLELRGEANLNRGYDAWARVGMITSPHPSLSNLPWKRFRVLTMASC